MTPILGPDGYGRHEQRKMEAWCILNRARCMSRRGCIRNGRHVLEGEDMVSRRVLAAL